MVHPIAQVACECEITECQPLPDGRFYLEIVGRRRFSPLDTAEQVGFWAKCWQVGHLQGLFFCGSTWLALSSERCLMQMQEHVLTYFSTRC